jgi:TM2 domain-containing membrane protein YozV
LTTAPVDYRPIKSKAAAGILAILLGGIGVHKFYLGKAGLGIVYLLFCWTFIPGIIALIEGIIYLTQDDATFAAKNNVRVV